MDKIIAIETKKYSSVIGAILDKYGRNAKIRIDDKIITAPDTEGLRQTWCTNRSICQTRNFELRIDDQPLFGFHDHPRELWAAVSEQQFIDRLKRVGLIRYRVLAPKEGFLTRIIKRFTTRQN